MSLDLATARRIAAEVVASEPEGFAYNIEGESGCFYVPLPVVRAWDSDAYTRQATTRGEDDPRERTGCLVGRILDVWGETDVHRTFEAQAGTIDALASNHPGLIDGPARDYLRELQSCQDNGRTWQYSLESAERWIAAVYPTDQPAQS